MKDYIGKSEGGFAILDSIRLKLGVSETIPGKWKSVASSSFDITNGLGLFEGKNNENTFGYSILYCNGG